MHGRRGERQARSGPTSAGMGMRQLKKDEDADGGVACRSRRNETKQTQVLFAELTHGKQQQGVEAKASAAHAWLLRQLLPVITIEKNLAHLSQFVYVEND